MISFSMTTEPNILVAQSVHMYPALVHVVVIEIMGVEQCATGEGMHLNLHGL